MGYRQDREAFVYRMACEGATLGTIRTWLHYAGVLQRAAEIECSVQDVGIRERAQKNAESAWNQAFSCAPLRGWWWERQGDPRGYVVKFYPPGTDPDTSIGIGVPAQGYRAAQMERMTRGAR